MAALRHLQRILHKKRAMQTARELPAAKLQLPLGLISVQHQRKSAHRPNTAARDPHIRRRQARYLQLPNVQKAARELPQPERLPNQSHILRLRHQKRHFLLPNPQFIRKRARNRSEYPQLRMSTFPLQHRSRFRTLGLHQLDLADPNHEETPRALFSRAAKQPKRLQSAHDGTELQSPLPHHLVKQIRVRLERCHQRRSHSVAVHA